MSKLKELRENRFVEKEEKINIEEIFDEIRTHLGKGTESNPEEYATLFLKILLLSEVPKDDFIRYSKCVIDYLRVYSEKEVFEK